MSVLAFPELEPAYAPVESLGRTRTDVALLVATRSDGTLRSARFEELPRFLFPGDLLVVNTSATLPAALPARLGGVDVHVHLSTPLAQGRWVVELRTADLRPLERPPVGTRLELPDRGRLTLLAPYRGSDRLTEAEVELPGGTSPYLARHGAPIRYANHGARWPLLAYQTAFALEPGSAEMPSAGRPFSPELVTELVARGVLVAPLTLHAGVSSLERDEAPYPERYRVPAETARLVNAVHAWDGRVIAVGPDRRPCARDRGGTRRHGTCRRGLDGRRDHARARPARCRRARHGLARAGVVAPAHARGRGRPRAPGALLRRGRRTRLRRARVRRRSPGPSLASATCAPGGTPMVACRRG